jgi:hypothetical protein
MTFEEILDSQFLEVENFLFETCDQEVDDTNFIHEDFVGDCPYLIRWIMGDVLHSFLKSG